MTVLAMAAVMCTALDSVPAFQTLSNLHLFHNGHSSGYEVTSDCGFHLHSLASDVSRHRASIGSAASFERCRSAPLLIFSKLIVLLLLNFRAPCVC